LWLYSLSADSLTGLNSGLMTVPKYSERPISDSYAIVGDECDMFIPVPSVAISSLFMYILI
jgi:hypothetical protein